VWEKKKELKGKAGRARERKGKTNERGIIVEGLKQKAYEPSPEQKKTNLKSSPIAMKWD